MKVVNDFKENTIYCGDNLVVLKDFPDECVDLIYIDPPFFSGKNYEIIWRDGYEKRSFKDRWEGGMQHYIGWMKPRIEELYRVLKNNGSFWLHCDYHASHYLKIVCDEIFGLNNFRSVIYWKRSDTHNDSKSFGNIVDTILYYSKSSKFIWNTIRVALKNTEAYRNIDKKGKYMASRLDAKGLSGGGYQYKWKGVDLLWRCPIDTMKKLENEDKLYYSSTGRAYKKVYLSEHKGVPVGNLWNDIINVRGKEKLGYPTQKPEKLLGRIIKASSNCGDIVLDCYCGCGTTLAVAKKLKRKYIGVDISPTACLLMSKRINYDKNKIIGMKYNIKDLKNLKPFEFQNWIVERIGGKMSKRKTGDMGIDGLVSSNEHGNNIPIEVKQSNISRPVVDKFETVLRRTKKKTGIIVGFGFTKGAIEEIARCKREDEMNIVTIRVEELINGKKLTYGFY